MSTVTPLPQPGESEPERAVLAALASLAERMPGLGYVPNVIFHASGHRRELDVLVTYRGRAFVVETDGPHHARAGRYVADRSKDALIENAGVLFVRRIAVEDTRNPQEVEVLLRQCITRLSWLGGAA